MKKPKELNVYYLNAGSCNGCDIELAAGVLLNESKDIVKAVLDPKKADITIFTGILTKKIKPYFLNVLKKLPPKAKKVAFGSCAISGNAFSSAYTFAGPVDSHTKIDLYINGCPPKGDEYLRGVLEKLGLYPKKKVDGQNLNYWRGELKFFPEKCIGCMTCVYYCPAQTIKVNPAKKGFSAQGGPALGWELSYNFEKCFFCSMCQRKCPTGAITLTHNPLMIKNKKDFVTKGDVTKGRVSAKIDPTKI